MVRMILDDEVIDCAAFRAALGTCLDETFGILVSLLSDNGGPTAR